jgi:hypothetical protein
MDTIFDNLSGLPIKGGMTLGAPHLITSVDFVNDSVTIGTRFAFFLKTFYGFEGIRIALMRFFVNLFETRGTHFTFTDST